MPQQTRQTEAWRIEYDFETPKEIVHVEEPMPCVKGYHDKLLDRYKEMGFPDEVKPIYKVRGNYLELFAVGIEGGRHLPLTLGDILGEGRLLCSEEHPIVLFTPDNSRYEFTTA